MSANVPAADERTVRVSVRGRVQGVWFRGWAVEEAHALGLSGWVRNRRDGSVELRMTGPGEAVARMIAACWRGPRAARVTDVQVKNLAADHDLGPRFVQRPSA